MKIESLEARIALLEAGLDVLAARAEKAERELGEQIDRCEDHGHDLLHQRDEARAQVVTNIKETIVPLERQRDALAAALAALVLVPRHTGSSENANKLDRSIAAAIGVLDANAPGWRVTSSG